MYEIALSLEFIMTEYLCAAVIGIFAGILAGMVGIGGGILMIPALVYLMGFSQPMAQGTTLAAMIPPIGLLAAYAYYEKGFVNIPVAACIAAGFLIGGFFGGRLAVQIDAALLRKGFAIFLMVISIKMFFTK